MNRIRNALRRLNPAARRNSGEPDAAKRVARLERDVVELRAEIDELRRDSARVAEVYDLVFERLRERRD